MITTPLRKLAKALLKNAGYEVRKLEPAGNDTQTVFRKHATHGTIIEFIGPSGAGKSFLFAKAWPHLQERWMRDPVKNATADHLVPNFAPYWSLILSATQGLANSSLNDYQRAKVVRQLSSVIVKDSEIRNQVGRSGFVLQEGLFHNFPHQLMALPDQQFQMAASSRALILVLPQSPDTIIERRQLRVKNGGHLSTWHAGMDRAEQHKEIESRCALIRQLSARAEAFGIVCLRVNAEDPIRTMISSVVAFEKQFNRAQ